MRKPLLWLLAATLLTWTGACGKRRASGRPLVGVTLLTDAHVFYQDLKRGMQQAADSLGLDLQIVAGEWDLARQTAQVDNFINARADAIVIAPVNSSGIVSAIEEANRAGIPVFTADIASDGGTVVAHVASDNRQGGRLLGAYVGRRLGGGGNVVILDQPTVTSVRDRVAGFREALRDYPNIRVVASPAVERGIRDVAKQKMDNLLATGQRIDAVFGTNDDCALGALAAIQAAGRPGIIIVGYDATPEARSAISQGTALVADAVQDPVTIGRRTMEAVAARLKGGAVAPVVPVPVGLVERGSLPP
ncbi:MAG TPA: substrate-binding domain-containing protein [Gemmatimonadales bacterium]|nr:substrate-binding domain-containing protein [Gemmatimonadales bacterium]